MTLALIVWLVMAAFPALNVIGIILASTLALALFGGILCTMDDDDKVVLKWVGKQSKWAIPIILLCALIPNEKTSWYMVGAYGTQKLVESPVAQELASDGVDVLKSLMARAKAEIEEKPKK